MRCFTQSLLIPLTLAVLAAAQPYVAHAQGKPGGAKSAGGKSAAAPAAPPALVKGIQDKLKTNDPPQLLEALAAAQAGGAGAVAAAPAIEDLLKRGSTAAVMKAAIEALGAIAQPSSSGVLRPYVRHRNQDVRRAAIKALASTKGQEAVAAFKEALRSGDGMVRGYSASGLGNLGATDALPDLFTALEHNVTEAAAAIGQLCSPDECDKFAGRFLGKVGFDVMTSGFDPILFRAAKPLPEEAIIKIVGRVRELGTPEAAKYLGDVQGRWPATASKKVKQAIDSAIASLPGGAGGK